MSAALNATQDVKPLPSRPGQTSIEPDSTAYGNHRGAPSVQSNSSSGSMPHAQAPNGRGFVEAYRKDIMNNFAEDKARYNPINTTRPQSSMLFNDNDPIQVHLLVETALGDSKEFEVLSQEEVDDLKRQCRSLEQRIEQTRQSLMIQSKYRDAAISMSRLYSPGKRPNSDGKRSRVSILGLRTSGGASADQTEQERLSSERKCEDLALELFNVEKRLMEPQKRLLQHTAGILQMTHNGPVRAFKKHAPEQKGIPGSPESLYTYPNAPNSIEPNGAGDSFDDRSLYRTFDKLDGLGIGGRPESFDIRARNVSSSSGKEQNMESMKMIARTEQKLENLNDRLREVIMQGPKPDNYEQPPQSAGVGASDEQSILSQLDYLGSAISAAGQVLSRSERDRKTKSDQFRNDEIEIEEVVEEINRELRVILLPYDTGMPEPPGLTGKSLKDQLRYLQSSIGAIEFEIQRANSGHEELKTQLARANSVNGRSLASQQDNLERLETTVMGLWEIIQSSEADARQKKLQRRQLRTEKGIMDEESDASSDEMMDTGLESFSLQAFSSKVQWLFAEATSLKDHKKVLTRQIKQQRELNSKGDIDNSQLSDQLQRSEDALRTAEAEAQSIRNQLTAAVEQLETHRNEATQRDLERSSKVEEASTTVQALEEKLHARNNEIEKLEYQLEELRNNHSEDVIEVQSQLSEAQARIANLTTQLADAGKAKAEDQEKLAKHIQDTEAEMETLNIEIARLTTEVTIARAELDGAYGSRAQRAAEVAANPAIQKEIDDLMQRNRSLASELEILKANSPGDGASSERVAELQKELGETIEEYEIMTKASIEWEKEREGLEREIDKLREDREGLAAKLSDEQVKWMGMRSPGVGGAEGGASNTSTTVLRTEFKKMMRDTRMENVNALRAEQSERRRIEDELRALKKQLGPGKSGLSRSMGSR